MSTDTAPAPAPTPTDTAPETTSAGDHLLRVFNDGAIAVLGSIGFQTGLFETMATLPPATSQQIADAADLDERYVREWLGGVTTAGFVDYEPTHRTYALDEEHAAFLTGPGPDNIARALRYITLMGQVTPLVVEKFRTGGGLDYADYPGFHDVQAQESAAVNDAALLDTIVPLTGLVDRLVAGIDVADFGCGEGHAINLMARAFPRSRFTGFDFSAEALEPARAEARDWGLTNAQFVARDVAAPGEPAAYDLVTAFDAIHDQAHPATVLATIRDSLRPGGTFLMVDLAASSRLENNLDLPWAGFLYAISVTHCMSVSLGQGGDGLGTVWGTELASQMLGAAGFGDIQQHDLEDDPFNVYFVCRR